MSYISSDPWKSVQKCSGNVEDCGDKKTNFKCNLDTQLLLIHRMNLNSVKGWCTCGYCSVMPINRECLCCREIDDMVSERLSDVILIYVIQEPCEIIWHTLWFSAYFLNLILKFLVSNRISGSCSKDGYFFVSNASSNY